MSHEKDFERERKRDHVKSIGLLLSDFSMVVFEDAVRTVQHAEKLQCLVAKKSDSKKRALEAENFIFRACVYELG